jgi:hypothetical protein
MFEPDPAPVFDAFAIASRRQLMPTSLGTAGLRNLGAKALGRSVFTARGTSMVFTSKIKEVVDKMASGSINEAEARVTLRETLKALGYTPEGGFPDAPAGSVPPALKGTLQDLSSFRRLDLIVRTQIDLMRGAGQQFRGHTPDRLESAPAWELVRIEPKAAPRDWPSRWVVSGGASYGGRMIALKGDPAWGELGSYDNFDDALGVDYPPFAFNSGMGWESVSRSECLELGVVGPDGQSIDEYHRGKDRPVVLAGPLPMPSPSLSVKDVDPELVKVFKQETHAKPGKAAGTVDYSDLLDEAMADRIAGYERRKAS